MTQFSVNPRLANSNSRRKATEPLNWRRGLFRLWLLLSAAWLMSWTIYLTMYGVRAGFDGAGELIAIPILLFGPPIALLLFGLAARWTFRGFRPDQGGD